MPKKAAPVRNYHLRVALGEKGMDLVKAAKPASALGAQTFVAYAGPSVWGPSTTIASHIGSVTYTIDYEAVGDTLVLGRVTYFKGPNGGSQVVEQFNASTTITTADCIANVSVEFKGIPTGSTVNGTISP